MKKNLLFRKGRLILISILFFLQQLAVATGSEPYGQNARLTLSFKDVQLKVVLEAIEKQSEFYFVYNHKFIDVSQKVSITAKSETIQTVLDKLFKNTNIRYEIVSRQIVLNRKDTTDKKTPVNPSRDTVGQRQQGDPGKVSSGTNKTIPTIQIKGKIVDSDGKPLPGVSIYTANMMVGVASKIDGTFSLSVPDTTSTIVISMVGYERITAKIPKTGILEITLKDEIQQLAEAVITGYQTLSRERSTGSFSTISTKDMRNRLETNIMDKFEGMVPGLFLKDGKYSIRGISTLYANKEPLYVVDGFPYEGNISYINPADVVNVTVLKDAAAASIYGARAANGVIVITTRSGKSGKLTVNANSSMFITPLPDVSYLNLMSSKEIVDLQEELFNMKHLDYSIDRKRAAKSKALDALYQGESGEISPEEMNRRLNELRGLNNRNQIEKYLLQTKLKHQHSFSVSGGSDVNRFLLSINYIGNRGYEQGGKSENININFKDQVNITRWLDAELGIATTLNTSKTALNNAYTLYTMYMPYEMIKDENGELTRWSRFKSDYEIERLISLGLYDESYNPLREMDKYHSKNKSTYTRLQGGFTIKFMEGLKLDLMYQREQGNSHAKTLYDKDSYTVKSMINNATQIRDGEIIKNVPDGAQLYESRGDSRSYTMRAQISLDKVFASKHYVASIIGAERRSVATSSTNVHRLGYNDANLQFVTINAKDLASLKGTESLYGTFNYDESSGNYFKEGEDRYVSFYGNFGYTYDEKYTLTASARIDDSNLFGTDPRYRHLPMWSVGANWHLSKEAFLTKYEWINNLALRLTYGITGNVAREVGPFLQAESSYSTESEAPTTRILYPPNKSLRWERTAITNVGIDFSILKNRLNGSIDYYHRKTTDLLGNKEIDPTNAFQSSLVNYGSLYNKGIEFAINSLNINTRTFSWNTKLNISYNKNKMTKINIQNETVYAYTNGNGCEKKGYPIGSIFNFRWAGLDPENGTPRVYDKEGNIVINYDDKGMPVANMKDPEGLVYGGTLRPKYTIGFYNSFTWKDLTLSIMIIANGGNVMRDAVPSILTNGNFDKNMDKRAKNFWRKPGDENIPGIMPAPDVNNNGDSYYMSLWYSADINTLKADYIKVRNISLSYDIPKTVFGGQIFQSARLTFQVQNPFKWFRNNQDLDPEAYTGASIYANRNLPVTPCYMIGLDLNF